MELIYCVFPLTILPPATHTLPNNIRIGNILVIFLPRGTLVKILTYLLIYLLNYLFTKNIRLDIILVNFIQERNHVSK